MSELQQGLFDRPVPVSAYSPKKKNGPREWYVNWGSWFPNPVEDRDLLARLPEWRQAEIEGAARASREHPEAVSSEVHSLVTGKAIPGQMLLRSFMRDHRPMTLPSVKLDTRPSITDPQLQRLVQFIPDSIPLSSIRARAVDKSMASDRIYDLTPEQFTAVLDALKKHVTADSVFKNCTPHGKGGYIKHSKPTDGVFAYIWRMARLFNGEDARMPVTADWDLSDGLEKLTGLRIGFYPSTEFKKGIMAWLETYADLLVLVTGGNPLAGSIVWGRAMGWKQVQQMDTVAAKMGVPLEELSAVVCRLKAIGAV